MTAPFPTVQRRHDRFPVPAHLVGKLYSAHDCFEAAMAEIERGFNAAPELMRKRREVAAQAAKAAA